VSGVDLGILSTTDAVVWAREFVKVAASGRVAVDEATMVGWFANAIETGRNAGIRASEVTAIDTCGTPPASDGARAFITESKPGELWAITRACDEHRRAEGAYRSYFNPFKREAGPVHPCCSGCVYERVIEYAVLEFKPFGDHDDEFVHRLRTAKDGILGWYIAPDEERIARVRKHFAQRLGDGHYVFVKRTAALIEILDEFTIATRTERITS
jgi:hypothetical protein